jgi:hypothetical protein
VHEITLHGAPPAALAVRSPAITSHPAPEATILCRHVADPAEVDELLERLRSVGITPLEVRISPDGYEFRIEGRLGDGMAHYMQCAARVEPQRTIVRARVTSGDLRMILKELADSGIQIDHLVRRTFYGPTGRPRVPDR